VTTDFVRGVAVACAVALVASPLRSSGAASLHIPTRIPISKDARLSLSVVLRNREAALARYLDAVNDSKLTLFRHFLSPADLGRRFGPPAQAVDLVRRELAAAGFHVTETYPQRTAVDFTGTAADISRYFKVALVRARDGSGIRYHRPAGLPTIPRPLRPWVIRVVGLDTRPVFTPADVRTGALEPVDAAHAYDITPLRRRGVIGSRQIIAIVSFAPFRADVVKQYARWYRLSGPAPKLVRVRGGATAGNMTESHLDIEVVRAIAPGARILFYSAPNTEAGAFAMYNRILKGPATIISDSWGYCDRTLSANARKMLEKPFAEAAGVGKSYFVASGDAGAYDCQRTRFADHHLSVDFPSDSPFVVSVGGTLLDVRTDGSYWREAGWEDPLTNGGGGGGVNTASPKPRWQAAFGVGGATRHRVVPDVSAAASSRSGWWVKDDPGRANEGWTVVGGTSAAAPFWAASMALVQEWSRKKGSGSLCFAAPILYTLAYSSERFRPFHDVVRGGNRFYDAHKGWDFATGLGSPDVWNLARAAAAYLRGHPGTCKTPRPGGAGSGQGGVAHFPKFRLPSGNIGCEYLQRPNGLRCDMLSGLRPKPTGTCNRPARWAGLALLPGGSVPNCARGAAFTATDPVLTYGRRWRRGAFTCSSATVGLRCSTAGHGFFLSRERWSSY
jgi:subtilase family serine protease